MDFTKHENVVDEWLAAFAAALDQRNIDRVLDLFEPKAFWRDLATFTWNIYTAEGRDAIRAMLTTVSTQRRRQLGRSVSFLSQVMALIRRF